MVLGKDIASCKGGCTNWGECVDIITECKNALETKKRREAPKEKQPINWLKVIMISFGFFTIMFCLVCIVIVRGGQKKKNAHWRLSREFYDQQDSVVAQDDIEMQDP